MSVLRTRGGRHSMRMAGPDGLWVAALVVACACAGQPVARAQTAAASPSEPTRLVIRRLDGMKAHVSSVREIQPAPGRSRTPGTAVTGASGLGRFGQWTFVVQDDSTLVAAMSDDGRIRTVRLLPPIEGEDRFHRAYRNRSLKPDWEAVAIVPVPQRLARRFTGVDHARALVPAIMVVGSGSEPETRDRIALVFVRRDPTQSIVMTVSPRRLYSYFRAEARFTGKDGGLNIESVAALRNGGVLRFYNRGNSGGGSVNASADIDTEKFLEYLLMVKNDPDAAFGGGFGNFIQYDLGTANGVPITIGEAVALPPSAELGDDVMLIAGIAENSRTATSDGETRASLLALHFPDGRLVGVPVAGIPGADRLKVEGLVVRHVEVLGTPPNRSLKLDLIGVVDTDPEDPTVPSLLVEGSVLVGPRQE